jgi:uncharacterized protein (TIGR00251 family)
MSKPHIQEDQHGLTFTAKIVPGSSRTALAGLLDDMIKIKVATAPQKGKANQSLVAFLAKRLGVKRSEVQIVAGQTSPVKQIRIAGLSAEAFLERMGLARKG